MLKEHRLKVENALSQSDGLTGKEFELFNRWLALDELQGYELTDRDLRKLETALVALGDLPSQN